jgi:hypothetical protein
VTVTTLLGLIFVVILAIEWRYRLRIVRLGAAVRALFTLFFAQANLTGALRRAMLMPPAQRITQIPGHGPLSDYQIGVVTMEQAVVDDAEVGSNARLMAIGMLAWLACSPAFQTKVRPHYRRVGHAGIAGNRQKRKRGLYAL